VAEDEGLDFMEKSGLLQGIDDARIVTDFAVGASGVGPVMGFDSGDFFPYADPAPVDVSGGSRPEIPGSVSHSRGDMVTTKLEKSIVVNVPIRTAYNQWTQFQEFPRFMGAIKSVTQLSDDRLEWVAEIAGVRRRWEAKILEQIPDQRIAWAATEGATNAGAVTFEDLGRGQTSVRLSMEFEPEGLIELVGDKLNVVAKQAEGDLDRFKAFIEAERYPTGSWRGTVAATSVVGTPGVDDAVGSHGDTGRAGVSKKLVAGAAAAAASVIAAAGARRGHGNVDKDGGKDDGARENAEWPAKTLDVGIPAVDRPSAAADADLGGAERTGRHQTDLGSIRTGADDI
jgi:uncharacterized membrane protein